MIVVHALDGTAVEVDENAVTLVGGPYPHDLGPHTYLHGVDRGVLVTTEPAAALVARLGVAPHWRSLPALTQLRYGSRDLPLPRSAPQLRRNG